MRVVLTSTMTTVLKIGPPMTSNARDQLLQVRLAGGSHWSAPNSAGFFTELTIR